jgi:hypothetical protein
MDLIKHPGHGPSKLIKQSNCLVLTKTLMSCVCKRCQDKVVAFLVLYFDDILLIGNDTSLIWRTWEKRATS